MQTSPHHIERLPAAAATTAERDIAFIVTIDGMATSLGPEAGVSRALPIARQLGLRDPEVGLQLDAAIQRAIDEGRAGAVVWRRPPQDPVLIVARPARALGAAVVRVEPLEPDALRLEPGMLAQLFSLSKSEAEIAAALAADFSLAEIAISRGVGLETVRGQVKSLLRKMELRSQKQLVRILTRIAVALA